MSEASETKAVGAREASRGARLVELARLFGWLGLTSFGGPAAHIALMRREFVVRRGWLSEAAFLDLLGAANLIPGPNSTELAIHIGRLRAGAAGLIVAGLAFIAPAMLVTLGFAWAYVEFGTLPQLGDVLYGIKPVILAIVAQAFWNLVPRAARTWPLRAIGVGAVVMAALGVHELTILVVGGGVALAMRGGRPGGAGTAGAGAAGPKAAVGLPLGPLAIGTGTAVGAVATAVTLPGILGVFCKIGALLFGSGYVLLAFLRTELVRERHWLSEPQLLDAVAVGQVTPGPVFTSATFVGYLLAGPSGALVATLGIFLPAFVFVALTAPLIPRLRASAATGAFMDGVNVASLALMAVVTAELGQAAVVDVASGALVVVALWALFRGRTRGAIGTTWLIAGGAAVGLAVRALG